VEGETIDNRETEDQELWRQLPQSEGEERAELLIQLAQQAIYKSSGNEALALAEQAHEIYKAMGARASSVAMANAITGIGYSLRELNRVDEATKALDSAIDLLRENGYPFVVDTMRTKASWYCEMDRCEEAVATYLEIVRVNEVDGNHDFVARDLFAASGCLLELSRWQEALEMTLKVREFFKAEKMVFEVSWCDLNIALAHAELEDGQAALEWGKRANDIGTLRKDNEMLCKSNYAMARANILLKQYAEAESMLLVAQDLVARSNDYTQVEKIEKALIEVYRATERDGVADEVERRLGTLKEIVE
jgi:tetratricopeptide (TPR) repeat protein